MIKPIAMVVDGKLRGVQKGLTSSDAQSAVFSYPGAEIAHSRTDIRRRTWLYATELVNDTGAEKRWKSILFPVTLFQKNKIISRASTYFFTFKKF